MGDDPEAVAAEAMMREEEEEEEEDEEGSGGGAGHSHRSALHGEQSVRTQAARQVASGAPALDAARPPAPVRTEVRTPSRRLTP